MFYGVISADDGLELWNQVAKCLEFLRNSSQILQQALKDPTAENTLPLPHHLHRYKQHICCPKLKEISLLYVHVLHYDFC